MAVSDTLVEAKNASALAEFGELLSSAGVYDLSNRARFSFTGKDRVRWLNGMITNNIRDLAVGQGVYAFLLTPQGKIQGDLFAYNRGESIAVDVDRSQLPKVLETLKRYIIMDKVEIAEESVAAIGVAGPDAAKFLANALGNEKVAELMLLQFIEITWNGVDVTVLRGDCPLLPAFELWIEPSQASNLKSALKAKQVSLEAVELLRIASGVPRYGQDIHDRDLPQETQQARALNFTKGCYIGQEIVERIRARGGVHRMFTGFHVEGELPAVGTKIQAEGKDVGEITSVATLPNGPVALGYIRREVAAKELTAGAASVKVASLPFDRLQ
ncbi:MAG TPA: folate-binding protein [Terriglobales bacterium]|jgi:aminomethyltransferase|nr:folate-binding protein [Terriglobales bacterium]